jgi:type IV pilus assembly protein PilY1
MDDAEQFLFYDQDTIPTTNPVQQFGPYQDPYWEAGCRKTFIILISDGEPNMDLQTQDPANPGGLPVCDPVGTPQSCPYRNPVQIAQHMYNSPGPLNNPFQVAQTYVVGFGTSHPPSIAPPGSPNHNNAAFNPLPDGATTCSQNLPPGSTDISINIGNNPTIPMGDCTAANLNPASAGGNTPNGRPSLVPCCTLHQIALAGSNGTTPAFFADNALALKETLAAILSAIIGTTTARTYPVYAPAGNQAAQSQSLPSPIAAYQFSSSFNVTALNASQTPSGMWTGNLVRERSSCAAGVAAQQTVQASLGDDYAANVNMDSPLTPRNFFTVIGAPVGGNTNVRNSDYTIRPFIPADDGFGTYAPDAAAPTGPTLTTVAAFPAAMSNYPAAFGISANQPVCNNAFGNPALISASYCTNAILNWEVGLQNPPQSGTQALPTFSRDPANCPFGQTCSKLGAIYHSTPAVVGAPNEFLIDDTYTTYSLASATEPIMLYTATIDGQLHAFQVASNNPAQVGNAIDGEMQNNELWSFMPPRVLQHILPNYNIPGVALVDGAPVIADVPGQVYSTTMQAQPVTPVLFRQGTPAAWHRVLLGSGGSAGGYYYALDVTDPNYPEFLWQLSTDASGNPMFGLTTPTPTIAIVAITIGGTLTQVPVAILPGGSGATIPCVGAPPVSKVLSAMMVPGTPSYPISIAAPNDPNNLNQNNPGGGLNHLGALAQPLSCWDNSVNSTRASGNSLTIVRLDTGQVLAHFIGSSALGGADYSGAPGPGGGSVAQNNNKINDGFSNVFAAPFAAPLTGNPIAYPNQTGQVADRVYIGDADGLLWRIDLSSPNPANWTPQIAWDPYLLVGDAGLREPAQLTPLVSRDPLGDVVVIYATGDQNVFTAQQSSIRVWSLTETPNPAIPTGFQMSQNWWMAFASQAGSANNVNCAPSTGAPASQLPSACNRRVTGPMALFNSVLYFSTFTPQSSSVCSDGFASLWAVDFVRPDPMNQPLPLPHFPTAGAPALYQDGQPGSIIEGTSVSQTVSCDVQNGTMGGDPYFGTHNLVSNVTQATYQLNWNAGAGTGLSGAKISNDTNNGYNNAGGSKVGTQQSMQIAGPGQATRIDSWGAVIGQ